MDWWYNRTPRERWLLLGATLVLGPLLVHGLLWQPLTQRQALLQTQLSADRALLAWIRQAGDEVRTLRRQGVVATTSPRGSLLARVDGTLTQAGLRSGLERISPEGEHQVRLVLNNLPFADIIRWLDRLTREQAVRIGSFHFTRAASPGRVDARLTLESD